MFVRRLHAARGEVREWGVQTACRGNVSVHFGGSVVQLSEIGVCAHSLVKTCRLCVSEMTQVGESRHEVTS